MSENSSETRKKILQSAQAEFLEKGFTNASLRTIASNANLTTGAMYRHFKDKDSLFCALVDDVIDYVQNLVTSVGIEMHKNEKNVFSAEHNQKERQIMHGLIEHIYSHFDAYTLLLTKAAGSTHENFLTETCDLYTEKCIKILDWMCSEHPSLKKIDRLTVHFVASSLINALAEIVFHKIPKDEVYGFIDNIQEFSSSGLMHIIGAPLN